MEAGGQLLGWFSITMRVQDPVSAEGPGGFKHGGLVPVLNQATPVALLESSSSPVLCCQELGLQQNHPLSGWWMALQSLTGSVCSIFSTEVDSVEMLLALI